MIHYDFSRPATLGHYASGTATFGGATELGRASATIGSGDAGVVFVAKELGVELNGLVATIRNAGRISAQVSGGAGRVDYTVLPTTTALEASEAFQGTLYPALNTREAAALRHKFHIAASYTGNGTDPAATGSATFAGGADPDRADGFPTYGAASGSCGLFCFDHSEPLKLHQVCAALSASLAWTLSLKQLNPTHTAALMTLPIASGTSQNIFHSSEVIIPPGWGLAFTAAGQGRVTVTVSQARS